MPSAVELLEQAARSRDSATRAYRLATTVNGADATRLQSYGDKLLEEASAFERQAAALEAGASDRTAQVNQRQQEQQPQQAKSGDQKK
jgi:hypothetical protein